MTPVWNSVMVRALSENLQRLDLGQFCAQKGSSWTVGPLSLGDLCFAADRGSVIRTLVD